MHTVYTHWPVHSLVGMTSVSRVIMLLPDMNVALAVLVKHYCSTLTVIVLQLDVQ